MVEAVVTLPVFIILFIGVFFIRDSLVVTQEEDTRARSCAWRYSRSACTEVPEDCKDLVATGSSGAGLDDADEGVRAALGDVESAGNASGGDGMEFVKKVAGDIIGPAINELFSRTAVSETEGAVERPVLFGGGTVRIEGHYQLACDLEERDPLSIAKDAWRMARGK